MTRRALPAVAALGVLALLVVVAYVRGGRPIVVHQTSGRVAGLSADERGVFWLEAADPAAGGRLFALTPRGAAECLFGEGGLLEAASAGDVVLALRGPGDGGALLAIPRAGGAATILAEGLVRPAGLVAHSGEAYWTETRATTLPFAPHIPAAQARTAIRALSLKAQGGPRTVACLNGRDAGFAGELVGGIGDRFYLLDLTPGHGPLAWSVLRAVPCAGGTPETLAVEAGPQDALLSGDRLYLTGASEDAGDPMYARCVRRVTMEGKAETLTDWLPSSGRLVSAGGRLHYASPEGLFRLQQRLAPPEPIGGATPGLPRAAAHGGYVHVAVTTEAGDVVSTRAVGLGARLRAGLRWR